MRNHGFPSAVSKEFNRHNFGDIIHTFPSPEGMAITVAQTGKNSLTYFVDLLLVDDTFPDKNNTTNCYIDVRMYVVLNFIVKLKEKKCYSQLFGDVCAKHKRRPSMPARPYFH